MIPYDALKLEKSGVFVVTVSLINFVLFARLRSCFNYGVRQQQLRILSQS